MKRRKLFCEISPITYGISILKCQLVRRMQDLFSPAVFAKQKSDSPLPVCIYKHNSLMRRKLGNVDHQLQEHKVVNLNLSAPRVSGILIRPGETFSFWRLVGNCTKKKGYREGLLIRGGEVSRGIGGGMCQFTNLIHWLVLHTPLDILEHHHHDGMDLFPDYGRQIPFGTGTSILYNYLDYRFQNNTDQAYQLIVYTTKKHLCGEIRTIRPLTRKYHIRAENECFVEHHGEVFRTGDVFRECVDKTTGTLLERQLIKSNYAKVMYDIKNLLITSEKTGD